MARLLECEAEEVESGSACAPLAAPPKPIGAVALVKGQYSFIAAPDGRAFRFKGGGIGLATSGSGDVLAGIVGGLAARGADPLTATLRGVWLHGEAGRILTERVGRVGFLAREICRIEVPDLLGADLGRSPCRSSSSPIRRATWTTLVDPGTPNGTPAVTMIRSPPWPGRDAAPSASICRPSPRSWRRRVSAPHARPTACRAGARSSAKA